MLYRNRIEPQSWFPSCQTSQTSQTSPSYYVSFGGFSQQTSERDDGRHAGAVQEEDGGQTLQVDGVRDVTQHEGNFPPNIVHQTAEKPADRRQE